MLDRGTAPIRATKALNMMNNTICRQTKIDKVKRYRDNIIFTHKAKGNQTQRDNMYIVSTP